MKYFLFGFLLLLSGCASAAPSDVIVEQTTNSGTVTQYQNQVKICDDNFDVLDSKSISTVDIIGATAIHTECYRKIAFDIIDSEYSQNATEMKQNFDDYVRISSDMTGFIERPDSCYPTCGTIVGIDSAGAARDAAKQYLDKLLTPPEVF